MQPFGPYYHPHRMPECSIEFGENRTDDIGRIMDHLSAKRAILVTGAHSGKGRTAQRIRDVLGERCVAFYTGCRPHSPVATVYEIADLVKQHQADVLIALGGGSTSDTAKAVACMLGEGRPIEEMASVYKSRDDYSENYMYKPKMPVIAIPTTFSGAEIANGFGVTKDGFKIVFRGDHVGARFVILDPVATLETDLQRLVESGMNGIAHGIEGLYSRSRQPLCDALALECIRIFNTYLPRLVREPDNLEVRMWLLFATEMGGIIITNARVGVHHGAAHCLGGRIGITHARANSVMLPWAMEFNLDAAVEPLARAAVALGVERARGDTDEDVARKGIQKIRDLQAAIGVPQRLRDLPETVTEAQLDQAAADSMRNRSGLFNPKTFTAEDVRGMFARAW